MERFRHNSAVVMVLGLSMMLTGCPGPIIEPPIEFDTHYEYESRFKEGSSVAYTGQVFRHILIADLESHMGGLTERIDTGSFTPSEGDVLAELNFFYDFDGSTSGDVSILLSTSPETLQVTYSDLSASGAQLKNKIAGNEGTGPYKDWSTGFKGTSLASSPEALVQYYFNRIEELAIQRKNGSIPLTPSGAPISKVFVTEEGLDLQELTQKFLFGAVAFSQAADKYLDDATESAGLLSDNSEAEAGKPYTKLEHAWDEGFGYFGAARDYGDYSDEEIAGKGGRNEYASGYHDSNGDGKIDLRSEHNAGHAVYAAKRDLGSQNGAATDFTRQAWIAFGRGREIITNAKGPLNAEQFEALKEQRNLAIEAWEKAMAASAVHYLNEVLAEMSRFGDASYDFYDHAAHWSELKGFALGLQFNPRSPLSEAQFVELHEKLGDAPLLPGQGDPAAYVADLNAVKEILRVAYGFHPDNMGDQDGLGGW